MSDPKLDIPAWDLQAHTPKITCVKCQYTRQPSDTAPLWQCPKCEVAYEKSKAAALAAQQRNAARRAARDEDEDEAPEATAPSSNKTLIIAALVVVGALGAYWMHKNSSAREKAAQKEAAVRLEQIDTAKQQILDDEKINQAFSNHGPGKLEALNAYAAAGSVKAMLALGRTYHGGNGVATNYELARSWYQKAADQGSGIAMVNLGFLFEMGQGVDKQPELAANWYLRAARQGHASGLYSLATLVEKGIGVGQDTRRAYMLYELANRTYDHNANADYYYLPSQRSGSSARYNQSEMEKTMSPVDIVKAREQADAWQPGQALP